VTAKQISFYKVADGLFLPGQMILPSADAISANTPIGCVAIEGWFDHLSQRFDLETDQVVDYQPPPPADDALQTWAWDASRKRWLTVPTVAAIAANARAERDRRMAAADWVTLRAVRTGQPIPTDWATYLQALADVPTQLGFPHSITWPIAPDDTQGRITP
jgi:hypothetical protein